MAKKSPKAKSKGPKPRKQRGYRCLYRAFVRLCGERDPIELLELAEVGGKTAESRQHFLNRLKKGVPVEKDTFPKLAKELRCEPSSLYFMPEQMVPRWDSPSYQFAIRVAELIDQKEIPAIDPDTNEPTDVVRYVWEMGDSELDAIRLTYRQEREAFMLLRDYLMQVVERPLETKRARAKQLGAMEIGVVPKDDVIADVRARKAMSLEVFSILAQDFENNPFHINRIRAVVGPRVEMYLDAQSLDQTQWRERRLGNGKQELDEWGLIGPKVNMELVRNVIEADFHVRKVIFPTYQQDIAFSAYYGRSRQLIEWGSPVFTRRVSDLVE